MWLLFTDAWRAQSWWDKFRVWFMPLGWRPKDVAEKYPIYKIQDVYHFEKYNPHSPSSLMAWSWMQMIMVLLFISYLFGNIADIGSPDMFVYGAFIFVFVYAYTELLDLNPQAYWWQLMVSGFGIYLIISTGDWFGLKAFIPGIQYFLFGYFALSLAIAWWFCRSFNQKRVSSIAM
jgi:uncharacterized membrane protein AbrB (regulator of aidB expression)